MGPLLGCHQLQTGSGYLLAQGKGGTLDAFAFALPAHLGLDGLGIGTGDARIVAGATTKRQA